MSFVVFISSFAATTPKSMQQIAFLIIAFSMHVQCIRNTGYNTPPDNGSGKFQTAGNFNSLQQNYASSSAFESSPQLNDDTFRPSQIIDFTLADATVPQRQPPSYLAPHYYASLQALQSALQPARQPVAETRQDDTDKQFTFPAGDPLAAYHSSNYLSSSTPAVPQQLQTTPILTYKDPYTNENYHYQPTTTPATVFAGDNYDVQLPKRSQEFTVHSSLLVGGNQGPAGDGIYHSRPQQEQRPGYVFEEPLGAGTYVRPQANKYAQRPHPNALSASPTYQRPINSPYLSYDSPPSYAQQQQPQQQQYPHYQYQQQSPQRQDTDWSQAVVNRPPPSNYANNFGNYLTGPTSNDQHYYQPPPPPPQPPSSASHFVGRPPPNRPVYNNYYEYQLGEVPPSTPIFSSSPSNYRPPPPPPPPSSPYQPVASTAATGLATLASLFTTTQQYAPQFTNLLLGTLTGGTGGLGGGGGSAAATAIRPPSMQLIKALENIARNDDLQCVPKVLCQMIARQTQRGQLPGFVTSPAITNFLAGFPASSPALIYGRAALLGISGGERSCTQTYAKCPKNEYQILYYLNNHRGGFFKFFSEPEEKPQATTSTNQQQTSDDGGGGADTFLSILSALTGGGKAVTTTPRPAPKPKPASPADDSLDITGGIGDFFTQVLSEYIGGVEYQRRRRRRSVSSDDETDDETDAETEIAGESDIERQATESLLNDENFHDAEDDEDTQTAEATKTTETTQYADVEGRILHKELIAWPHAKFFPQDGEQNAATEIDESLENLIREFNKENAGRKLKFPADQSVREYEDISEVGVETIPDQISAHSVHFPVEEHHVNFIESPATYNRHGKELNSIFDNGKPHKFTAGQRVVFPDHYVAGHIRKGRILNRPTYASTYIDYVRNYDNDQDRFILPNTQRPNGDIYNFALSSQSNINSHLSYTANSQTHNYYGAANGQRYPYTSATITTTTTRRPYYNNNYNNNYNYNNYANDNRYQTTRRPIAYELYAGRPTPAKHEDDKNVYVNNGQGVTEYYITPEGRRVYLRPQGK